MYKKIFFVLLCMPFLSYGQNIADIPSIAKKLTGTWVREYYEKDSVRDVQKAIGDEVFWETYINGQFKKRELKGDPEGYNGMKLSFTDSGKGYYHAFTNYPIEGRGHELIEIYYLTCSPAPELRVINGEVMIYIQYMGGEGITRIIELTDKKMVWYNEEGFLQGYRYVYRKVE